MPTRIPDEADDATRALLEWVAEADLPPLHGMSAPEARRAFDERRERVDLDPVPVARVEDRVIDSAAGALPVRVYEPRRDDGARPPLLAYFHGGGFVIVALCFMQRMHLHILGTLHPFCILLKSG